jgi:curli biogenesis system outer membrane secretion channel CsgG
MLRAVRLVLLVVALCVLSAFANNKPDHQATKSTPPSGYTGPKKRIAVTDMEIKVTSSTTQTPNFGGGTTTTTEVDIPMPTDFGQGMTEMLVTALIDTKRFIVLERKALADIQAEQTLGAGGAVDAGSAATPGKLLGAQALVRGAVTEFTYHRSSKGGSGSILPGVNVSRASAEAAVVLDIRLYDTSTGQVLDSVKAEGRAKSSGTGVGLDTTGTDERGMPKGYKMSAASFSQTPLGHATRQAIDQAVTLIIGRMEKVPWEAYIAEIDTAETDPKVTLYLNAGSEMGVKVGDMLEIFHPGRPIIDPQTKLAIGRTNDTRLGACKVVSITPTLAVAIPTEGTGFKKDDIVRFPAPQ